MELAFLYDRKPRFLDLLEVAESGAVGVEVAVTRHRFFRIEFAVIVEDDEGIKGPSALALETH